jgi:hypothetical protein
MRGTRITALALVLAACQQRMEHPLELGSTHDGELRVGVAKVDIMPLPFSASGACPEGRFCYETHKNLGAADGCPDNRDNEFEGILTRPEGGGKCVEPFTDANGNGRFDGLWIGGYNVGRAATASDRDVSIFAKAIVLTRDDEHVVLINLPFAGFPTLQLSFLRERVAALSGGTIARERVIPMTIHNHGVPDTQGLWGPDLLGNYGLKLEDGTDLQGLLSVISGGFGSVKLPLPAMNYRNNAYWFWVEDQVIEAVRQAVAAREPVGVRLGVRETPHRETGCQTKAFEGKVELDCDGDGVVNEGSDLGTYSGGDAASDCVKPGYTEPIRFLVEDLRAPFAMDYNVYTLQFVSLDSKRPVGTFIVWGHHVEEADRENTMITGDIAEYACDLVERRQGGICVFQVGPEGGLTSSNSKAIPQVDRDGFYHDCSGKPIAGSDGTDDFLAVLDQRGELKLERENYQDAISAGRNVAKTSLRSLELNPTVHTVAGFSARHLHALLPMDNPFFYLAGRMEIMTGMSLLLRKGIDRERGQKIKDIVFRGELAEDNQACGGAACVRTLLSFIELDLRDLQGKRRRVALATAPGELFPEYLVGRRQSSVYFSDIDEKPNLAGMAEISKHPDYPSHILTTDINPQVFVAVTGLKEVVKKQGFDELIVLAEAHGSFGYMMPRTDYLPVYEGFFDLLRAVAPVLDKILKANGGLHGIYRLADGEEHTTVTQILDDVLERYLIYVRDYRPEGGPAVNVIDHPNAYEEEVSMGPRSGDIIYNAMVGLATEGRYVERVKVPDDPNTDPEVLSLGKLPAR